MKENNRFSYLRGNKKSGFNAPVPKSFLDRPTPEQIRNTLRNQIQNGVIPHILEDKTIAQIKSVLGKY